MKHFTFTGGVADGSIAKLTSVFSSAPLVLWVRYDPCNGGEFGFVARKEPLNSQCHGYHLEEEDSDMAHYLHSNTYLSGFFTEVHEELSAE